MRKWMFVVGLLICALLFFISGTLTGYLHCEKNFAKKAMKTSTPQRRPSTKPKNALPKNALIGKIMNKETMNLKKKIRIPTPPALKKYQEHGKVFLQR